MYSVKNEGSINLVHEHNNCHFQRSDNSCSTVIIKQLKALVVFKAGILYRATLQYTCP